MLIVKKNEIFSHTFHIYFYNHNSIFSSRHHINILPGISFIVGNSQQSITKVKLQTILNKIN